MLFFPNAFGRSFFRLVVFVLPSLPQRITFILGENSYKNCLHAPQGVVNLSAKIAIAVNFCSPAATAEATATLSAHIVSPKEAFSILAPLKVFSFSVSIAAPTVKLE